MRMWRRRRRMLCSTATVSFHWSALAFGCSVGRVCIVDSFFRELHLFFRVCGGCGCGGRKKREIGHVKGHMVHRDDEEWNNQCNSQEFSEVIVKHLEMPALKDSRDAIYKELDAAYPDSLFTVFCTKNSTASYQADAKRYCMEVREGRSCYVFEF